eukprot:8195-Chlamydomonas_euryale.AAC.2
MSESVATVKHIKLTSVIIAGTPESAMPQNNGVTCCCRKHVFMYCSSAHGQTGHCVRGTLHVDKAVEKVNTKFKTWAATGCPMHLITMSNESRSAQVAARDSSQPVDDRGHPTAMALSIFCCLHG